MSRLVGWLITLSLPETLRLASLRWFAKRYRLNLSEAERALEDYPHIGALFTRRLKSGVRPLGAPPFVHPADSVLSESGSIERGLCLQAKGITFTVPDLLGDEALAKPFVSGGLFATYYLCPTDYHRVHSPCDLYVFKILHLPGDLWPVNTWSVSRIRSLFSINERVVVFGKTDRGNDVAVVMVGATNVGKMEFPSLWAGFFSNQGWKNASEKLHRPPHFLGKGEELGIFHMGSTVVLCLSQEAQRELGLSAAVVNRLRGKAVKMREAIP